MPAEITFSGVDNMIDRIVFLFVASVLLVTGCVSTPQKDEAETMYIAASALTKLSTSVESTVRYKQPPENISDQELLALATAHDPSLLTPFSGYTIKVLREDRHAVVLICSENSVRGLLEDAGCTAAMDKHLWQTESSDCKFTLSLATVCTIKK